MRLVQGQQSSEVATLQVRLGLRPEGYFDAKTTQAVKQWQAVNGLVASGDVDEQTWSLLFPPPPPVVQQETQITQQVEVEPVVESKPKQEENGPEENQAVTPEVNRILSGGGNKISNRPPSHSR
jgi:peptidoglycan hydrolase-like protein with peptidoglycan-binding domain